MTVHAVVLAAGQGTRMRSDRAKVIHEAAGKTLLDWVLDAVAAADPATVVVVVGYQADIVAASVPGSVVIAVQEEQLGTAHATEIALDALSAAANDSIVVLPGDMPLLRGETIRRLVQRHGASSADATVLTVELEDPTGYGRIVRSGDDVVAIVEHADATGAQRAIQEVNTGVYAFRHEGLVRQLANVTADNAQGERYLTDVIGGIVDAGGRVDSVVADPEEGHGVNDEAQLEAAAKVLRSRQPPSDA